MTKIRIIKSKDYVVMSNYHFKEKEMSLKAKGLLSEMLSLPDNWNYTIAGLVSLNKENESAIKSTLEELKQFGYLKITKLMPNETKTGRIEYIYDIYEKKQEGEKQDLENLGVEIQGLENQVLYNINNKIINNKIYYNNKELNDLFLEYLELRTKLKCKNTERAINLLLNELNKYDDQVKIQMINNSIMNSWKSVYPIKNSKIMPKWFNQNIEKEVASLEEQQEIEKMLKEWN